MDRRTFKRALIAVTLTWAALSTHGCATDAARVDREVGAHQPAEYKEGYGAGCDSGYVAAGHPYYKFRKDVKRYATDPLYKQGWDDGMIVCRSSYESIRL
ncbi:MAG TPA: hypothetical protein VFF26_06905 [Gallionella sp.]|nr:hypothetical protein [Gallionella sp.]